MTRLIQICASQNDLFGLDDEGQVYQYNFSTSNWMHLGQGRSALGRSTAADSQASIAPVRSPTDSPASREPA